MADHEEAMSEVRHECIRSGACGRVVFSPSDWPWPDPAGRAKCLLTPDECCPEGMCAVDLVDASYADDTAIMIADEDPDALFVKAKH
eukprot:11683740-Alexandrium_andersonii.AAC.1